MNRLFQGGSILLFLLLTLGCETAEDPAPEASGPLARQTPAEAANAGPINVPAENLPETGNPMPPLEGGTLELSAPAKWDRLPRDDKNYVVAFVADKTAQLPRMVLKVGENPYPSVSKLTKENVEEVAQLVEQRLAEGVAKKELVVLEDPLAMIIGGNPGVRYVLARPLGKGSDVIAEQQVIETIHGNKLYTFTLDVFAKGIRAHRDEAYAVFASMQFSDDAGASSTPPAGQPAQEPPAETEPAEATGVE